MLTLFLSTLLFVSFAQRTHIALKAGDKAPDFVLKELGSEKTFQLSSNFGKSPVFLIFGSYT